MSAQPNQPKHNVHPNSLANLRKFGEGGKSNPGGKPNKTPRVDVAYCRLLKMTPEEIAVFQPRDGAELLAFRQYTKAINNGAGETLAYAQEVTNRTDGKLTDKVEISGGYSPEVRSAIVFEAYAHYYRSANRDALHAALDAILDGFQSGDEPAARLALRTAMDEEEAAIDGLWSLAEETVIGGK